MSSRLLLNLGLVIFLGALTSLALFNSSDTKPISDFSLLNKTDITLIQISHQNTSININKDESIWHIEQPIFVEADEFRIHAILAILSDKQAESYDITPKDYKKFSLQPPLATLKLNQQLFTFGTTSSVNNKRYVLTNEKLFLLEDTLYPLITSGFKNLMRRHLLASNTKIKKLTIDDKTVFLNENSSWELNNKQISTNISSDELKNYIDNWIYIQAYAVTTAKPPFVGNEAIFTTTENKTIKLLVNKTEVNTVVINPEFGLSYQFDSTAFKSLTQPSHFKSIKN